ncbi:hypothetical protein LIER_14937 [Lithospermum erythrorhizon]|uniref:O-fucosyltransferase family protein n=1 Tax=Lithospermum erythrorhizon TaxID=34254 RepID=A0AAV3Q1X0_LITER
MKEHGAIYLTPFSCRLEEEIHNNPEYQRLRCRVGLILRAMGFHNSTMIYLAAGELFGGERFMKPFRPMFPHLENRSTVDTSGELAKNTMGLLGSAVDYMVCLLSDIFMPTYDGPSNFANNLMGHCLYYGFRTIIHLDRKPLAPLLIKRANGAARLSTAERGEAQQSYHGGQKSVFPQIRRTVGHPRLSSFSMKKKSEVKAQVKPSPHFGEPRNRIKPESFYSNSWPECFCQKTASNPADRCPSDDVFETLESQFDGQRTTSNLTSATDN